MVVVLITGAAYAHQPKTVREFFAGHRADDAEENPDWGLFKVAFLKGEAYADHVITVHGFIDNAEICRQLATHLKREKGSAVGYRCDPIN